MDTNIVNLALSFDGWVFGGYVRDVLICDLDDFKDIDIAIPEYMDINLFLKCLNSLGHQLEVYSDFDCPYQGNSIKRLIKIQICGKLVDLIVVSSFSDWKNDQSVDMSCNLFYKNSMHLGLRYIPDKFKYFPDPASEIIELTRQKQFVVIQDYETDKLKNRIQKRLLNGWIEKFLE
jgi:hypothetical protein